MSGLTVKLRKCSFAKAEVKFLGKGRTKPEEAKVKSFSTPINKKNLRSFMGLVGHYRKFYCCTALMNLTKKNVLKN